MSEYEDSYRRAPSTGFTSGELPRTPALVPASAPQTLVDIDQVLQLSWHAASVVVNACIFLEQEVGQAITAPILPPTQNGERNKNTMSTKQVKVLRFRSDLAQEFATLLTHRPEPWALKQQALLETVEHIKVAATRNSMSKQVVSKPNMVSEQVEYALDELMKIQTALLAADPQPSSTTRRTP